VRRRRDQTDRLLGAGAGLVGLVAVVGVLAPLLAPYDPQALVGDSLDPPSGRHLLGTNDVGQDLFSQLVWGARPSLLVAIGAAALTLALGVVIGASAGLVGGVVDRVVMRAIDVMLGLPLLPLLIVVAALAPPGVVTTVIIIGVMMWPMSARVVRSETLTLRQRGYVRMATGFGGGLGYVLRRHLLPALGPIVVAGAINVAGVAVLLEAGLAFLGLSDPTRTSWGLTLNRALTQQGLYLSNQWVWWVLPAAGAVTVAVLGITFVGVGLEPRLNPRARREPK